MVARFTRTARKVGLRAFAKRTGPSGVALRNEPARRECFAKQTRILTVEGCFGWEMGGRLIARTARNVVSVGVDDGFGSGKAVFGDLKGFLDRVVPGQRDGQILEASRMAISRILG